MTKRITKEMMIKADGQRIGEDSDYWVYLTNLKVYNEGILLGTYLYFPFDGDDLNQAFNQIYVGSEFVDEFGSPHEEVEKYLDYPKEVVKVISENLNQEFIIHNLYGGSTMEEKLGYALYDEGVVVVPEKLINYIDYEGIGRDYIYIIHVVNL